MQNDNFTIITGWMCNELRLSGNELLVYAAIYGFSKDGASHYSGGRRYLSESFNISLPTVDKALKGLVEKKYIIRYPKEINGVVFNEYYADLGIFQNFTGDKESLGGVVKNLYGGGKESLPNNINNNINESIVNSKENNKKKFDAIAYLDTFPGMNKDPEIKDVFIKFIEMRESIKHPITTEYGLKQLIKRAWDLGDAQKGKIIAVVNQSIESGYRGLFPLKDDNKPMPVTRAVTSNPTYNNTMAILDALYNEALAEEQAKEAAT